MTYYIFLADYYLIIESNTGEDDAAQKKPHLCWSKQLHELDAKKTKDRCAPVFQG